MAIDGWSSPIFRPKCKSSSLPRPDLVEQGILKKVGPSKLEEHFATYNLLRLEFQTVSIWTALKHFLVLKDFLGEYHFLGVNSLVVLILAVCSRKRAVLKLEEHGFFAEAMQRSPQYTFCPPPSAQMIRPSCHVFSTIFSIIFTNLQQRVQTLVECRWTHWLCPPCPTGRSWLSTACCHWNRP